MKLAPELVPRPLWGLSAHQLLRSRWQRQIRPAIVDEFAGLCSICSGATERMYAHEHWAYDEAGGIATLSGLALVCQDCNSCLHIGRLPAKHVKHALDHLAAVNTITWKLALELVTSAQIEWARRSSVLWTVEVDARLVERFPALAELPQRALAATSRISA